MDSRTLRKRFAAGLFTGLRIVWPILSVLFRADRHVRRGCRLGRRLIRAGIDLLLFRTGFTIGYGDFAPKTLLGRARGRVHAHASVSRCCAASHSPRNAAQTFVPADRLRRPLNSNVERLLSGSLHGRFGVVSSQA